MKTWFLANYFQKFKLFKTFILLTYIIDLFVFQGHVHQDNFYQILSILTADDDLDDYLVG